MISRRLFASAMLAFAVCISGSLASAAESTATVMDVGEMCGGCVKKITARLSQMPEVASMNCDIAKKTVTVTPKSAGISARALWDAMDEIGKTPKKLVDATGTYTQQPQN